MIAYFNAGGGHRAAARALEAAAGLTGRDWRISYLNLDEALIPADPWYRLLRIPGSELYNRFLRRGWTFGWPIVIRGMHRIMIEIHHRQVRLLRECWRELQPDIAVSVVPHLNRAMYDSLLAELPGTPFVTVTTDLADYPPHFWFEPQPQHFVCGTEISERQARAVAPPGSKVWRVSGMLLHPDFYQSSATDRAWERRRLGLDPDRPTALVCGGGYGSSRILEIGRRAKDAGVQLIFLCGHNARLAARLRELRLPYPAHVEEFTSEVPYFMSLADFFIGKPGPGLISEALAMGLPVIVEDSWRTLPHERYNAAWIREHGVGLTIRSAKQLPEAIARLLDPAEYQPMRQRIAGLPNRAVFEVLGILDSILCLDCGRIPPPQGIRSESSASRQGDHGRELLPSTGPF